MSEVLVARLENVFKYQATGRGLGQRGGCQLRVSLLGSGLLGTKAQALPVWPALVPLSCPSHTMCYHSLSGASPAAGEATQTLLGSDSSCLRDCYRD